MEGRCNRLLRLTKEQKPKKTDISETWSRQLDFNDFNVIFNHQRRNEHDNSFRFVQTYDLSKLKSSLFQDANKTEQNKDFLYCKEKLLPSDTEDENVLKNHDYFNDSDDSIKDKDYVPDVSDICSDDGSINVIPPRPAKLVKTANKSTKRKLENVSEINRKQKKINEPLINHEKTLRCDPSTQRKRTGDSAIVTINLNEVASEKNATIGNKCGDLLTKVNSTPENKNSYQNTQDDEITISKTRCNEQILEKFKSRNTETLTQNKDESIEVTDTEQPNQEVNEVTQETSGSRLKQTEDRTRENRNNYKTLQHEEVTNDEQNNEQLNSEDNPPVEKINNNLPIPEEIIPFHPVNYEHMSEQPNEEVTTNELNNEQQNPEDNPPVEEINNKLLTPEEIIPFYPINDEHMAEQPNEENLNCDEELEVTDKGLTKSGKPRQRRKFNESKVVRTARKIEEQIERLSLKTPCNESCKKKCITLINNSQRKEIHDNYTAMNYEEQGLFIKCMVDEKPVQRRLTNSKEQRQNTNVYHLKVNNIKIEVCRTYFLTTLGYSAKNDCRVRGVMKKAIDCLKTKRGSYERVNKIDRNIIKDHITKFNPCISHYRREHAPNRLYLPGDITITSMHQQFCLEWPNLPVSFDLYRTVVKDMNISFTRLGNEECEQCAVFENHNPNHKKDDLDQDCQYCISYLAHKLKYTDTRKEYKMDVDLALTNPNDVFYSADLQKVIMLPRIDQYKSAIFCPRIIAFNESYVPLGSQTDEPFAALWNETISGRNQEDIISTLQAFLKYKRDADNIILWLDNCAAQNKNWTLLSFMVQIVNSNLIAAKTITIKYFEPGHTFMSADSFHHQVEQALRKMGKVYDFSDFVQCVRATNSKKNFVKVMEVSDFSNYQDYASQHKLRKNEPRVYLKDIVAIRFEKGLYNLKYKRSHTDEEFQSLDFLQTKFTKSKTFPLVNAKTEPRGITEERKRGIVEKLVPLMPENRRDFWCNLPVTNALDLTQRD